MCETERDSRSRINHGVFTIMNCVFPAQSSGSEATLAGYHRPRQADCRINRWLVWSELMLLSLFPLLLPLFSLQASTTTCVRGETTASSIRSAGRTVLPAASGNVSRLEWTWKVNWLLLTVVMYFLFADRPTKYRFFFHESFEYEHNGVEAVKKYTISSRGPWK